MNDGWKRFIKGIRNRWSRLPFLTPLSIALIIFLVYNAILPVNLAESHDSLTFLNSIEKSSSPWLFHPHHLLYKVVGKSFYQVWQFLGYGGDASLPLRELNIIFGCLTIVVLYQFLKIAFNNSLRSALICIAVAFSYGFWFYSSTIEVYIIPVFFSLLCIFFTYVSYQQPRLKTFALVGIFGALAILFHLMNVLLVVTVLFAIFFNSNLRTFRRKFSATITYGLFLFILVSISYGAALALAIKPESFGELIHWFTVESNAVGRFEIVSLAKAAMGFGRIFVGGHFLFSLGPINNIISSVLGGKFLITQIYLAAGLTTIQGLLLLLGSIPLLATFITAVLVYIRSWKKIWKEHRILLFLALAWLIPNALFQLWFDPSNLELWIITIIPSWVLLSLPFFTSDVTSRLRYGWRKFMAILLPLAIVCTLLVNLFGSMMPLHQPERDIYLQKSAWFSDNVKSGDLIICSRYWLWGQYLERFTGAQVLGLADILNKNEDAPSIVRDKIQQTLDSGGLVYITSDSITPEATTLESYGLEKIDFTNILRQFDNSWDKVTVDGGDIVYILRQLPP